MKEFSDFLGLDTPGFSYDISDEYAGKGYAITDDKTLETIRLLARTEGILLDPVYTGKAFSGMIDRIQSGKIPGKANILFIHTGGIINIFTYYPQISDYLQKQ